MQQLRRSGLEFRDGYKYPTKVSSDWKSSTLILYKTSRVDGAYVTYLLAQICGLKTFHPGIAILPAWPAHQPSERWNAPNLESTICTDIHTQEISPSSRSLDCLGLKSPSDVQLYKQPGLPGSFMHFVWDDSGPRRCKGTMIQIDLITCSSIIAAVII